MRVKGMFAQDVFQSVDTSFAVAVGVRDTSRGSWPRFN